MSLRCADPTELDPSLPPVKPDLRIIEINLIGMVYTTKLALHYFRRQRLVPERDRCLILKASVAAYVDQPGSPQQVIRQEMVIYS
jgi:NAD(P)-dependent dehydrogenase (short-subunit alcohol dehydrogenase family)